MGSSTRPLSTLTRRNNLALALDGMGEYRRAAGLHQQTLTTRERVLGVADLCPATSGL
ncbi:MAG: tetratricopeptide repeat protein [Pseudonocardiaceae bacterium]